MNNPSAGNRDRIDLNDKAACETWVKRLNITHEKLHEAVDAVGDDPQAVEKHLRENTDKQQREGRGTM